MKKVWSRQDLIEGKHPQQLMEDITEMRATAGWQWMESLLRDHVTSLKTMAGSTMIANGEHTALHNIKVGCSDGIESVFALAEEAITQCEKRLEEGG